MDPTIIHAVNGPQILRTLRDAVNAPVDSVYDEKTFAGILQNLNQQAKQEQTAENVPKLAKAAASLAKAPESGKHSEGTDGRRQCLTRKPKTCSKDIKMSLGLRRGV